MADGFKIADAYVLVHADTSEVDKATSKSGKGFGGLTGMVGKFATGVAIAGAVAVGAIAGIALKGGFDRALNIQDAEAKLSGLGHSTESVRGIMDNALASVKGTAFGLDSAATVAATAVAAGIKPGEQLESTLRLVADAATIGGSSMEDMGSIFNKVAAGNRLSMEEVNQLSDRGIPVLAALGDQMGVTATEARDMVERGQVDFATFSAAMDASLGGAAAKSGETARGSFANVGAALSRLGASFAAPMVAAAPTLFQSITGAIDKVTAAIKPAAEAFGTWLGPAIEKVAGWIDKLDFSKPFGGGAVGPIMEVFAALSPLGNILKGLLPAIEPIGAAFQEIGAAIGDALVAILPTLVNLLELAADIFVILAPIIGTIATVIASVLSGAIESLLPFIETLVTVLGDSLLAVLPTVVEVINVLAGVLEAILPAVMMVVEALGGALGTALTMLLPIIVQLVTMLGDNLSILLPVIATLFTSLAPVVVMLIDAVMPLIPALLQIVTAILPLIPVLAQLLVALLPPLITLFMAILTPIISLVGIIVDALVPVIGTLSEWLGVLIDWIIQGITWFTNLLTGGQDLGAGLAAVWESMKAVIETVWNAIKSFFETIWNGIVTAVTIYINTVKTIVTNVFNAVKSFVETVWNGIKTFFSTVWEGIKTVVSNAINGVKTTISNVFNTIKSTVETIWGNIKTFISTAINNIKGYIDGLASIPGKVSGWFSEVKNGIVNKFNEAVNFVREIPGKITGALGDLGRLLLGAGGKIISGLLDGIRNGFNKVKETLGNLTDLLPDWKGPAERDATLLKDAGELIIDGFVNGLESRFSSVKSTLGHLTDMVEGTSIAAPGVTGGALSASSSGLGGNAYGYGSGAPVIIQSVTIDASSVKDFNAVVEVFNNISTTARQGRG